MCSFACISTSQVRFQVSECSHNGVLRAVNIIPQKEFHRGYVDAIKGQVRVTEKDTHVHVHVHAILSNGGLKGECFFTIHIHIHVHVHVHVHVHMHIALLVEGNTYGPRNLSK